MNLLLRAPRNNQCLAATAIAIFIIVLNVKVFSPSKNAPDSAVPPAAHVDSSAKGVPASTLPLKPEVKIEPRAYDPWPVHRPLPCSPSPSNLFSDSVQRSAANHGFLFVRLLKTGSASFLSAMIRASQQMVKRYHPGASYATCDMRVQHGWATDYDYGHRVIGKSFLYSLLRNPTERAISRFFYSQVSQKGMAPTDENFKNFLMWTHNHFYLQGLRLTKYDPHTRRHEEVVNEIIQNYDFIAITERMDESIVAVQMLLGLNTTDVIHFPARMNGGYDHGSGPKNQCVFIQKSFVTPGMQEFFESEQWLQRSAGDYMLYKAANQSLDMTIDRLGRPLFEEQLAHFRAAQVKAKSTCQVTFPCDQAGAYNPDHNCIYEDSGCGQACLDRVASAIDHPVINSPSGTTSETTSETTASNAKGGTTAESNDEDETTDEESSKESSTSSDSEKVAPKSASKATATADTEDEDGEEDEKPKSKPAPKTTKTTPAAAADEDEEEEEEEKPKTPPTKTKPATTKKSKDDEGEDEEEDEEEESTTTAKGGKATTKTTKEVDTENDDY